MLLFSSKHSYHEQLNVDALKAHRDLRVTHQNDNRLVLKTGRRLLIGIATINIEHDIIQANIGMSPRLLVLSVIPILIIATALSGFDGSIINGILAEAAKARLDHAITESLVKS